MNNLFKPASLLMYVLTLIIFFVIGASIAGVTGAAEGQGLAGGAIVFFYGVIGSFLGLVLAIFISYKSTLKTVININKVFGILFIILVVLGTYRYIDFKKKRGKQEEELPKKTTTPITKDISMLSYAEIKKPIHINQDDVVTLGIGFFSPNYFEYPTLYFYGGVNLEKNVSDHIPIDSLVFIKDKYNSPTTSYAPPWLYPEHLKLDYGIIIFKALGIGNDFVKVEANSINQKNIYLDKSKGTFVSWSSFLLSVNSVEFNENSSKNVFVKPLDYAGKVTIDFSYMQPLLVEEDWMYVKLVNDNLIEQGKGWILWKKEGKLLVRYSLLS